MAYQTLSGQSANQLIDIVAQRYALKLKNDEWTIEQAKAALSAGDLTVVEMAGLAKAILCFM